MDHLNAEASPDVRANPGIGASPGPSSPVARLVDEIGRAAQAGWAQTARMIALLTVMAAATALILAISR